MLKKNKTNQKKTLTPKQKSFVLEYLIDKNATQAAIRAKYSEKTADTIAARLLGNVKVRAEIDRQLAYQEKRTLVTADYVITGIKKIADSESTEDNNKLKAFELLAKHLGLLTENHKLSIDEPIRIEYVPAKTNRNNGSISQDTGE
jgi:phage terminase small subunit